MPSRGWTTYIGLGRETTWATAVSPTRFTPCRSCAVAGENVLIDRPGVRAKRGRPIPNLGLYNVTGDFQIEVDADNIGGLLASLLGVDTSEALATDVYRHTFTLKDAEGPSFTLQVDKDTEVYDVVGCRANTIDIAASIGELLLLTTGVIAQKDVYQATKATPSYSTIRPFDFVGAKVEVDNAVNVWVDDFTATLNSNLQVRNVLGSRYTKEPIYGGFEASGTFTLFFETATEYRRFWGSTTATEPLLTYTPAKLNLIFEGDTIAGTIYKYKLVFTFSKVIYPTASVDTGARESLKQSCAFTSYEDIGKDDVKVELINTRIADYGTGTW